MSPRVSQALSSHREPSDSFPVLTHPVPHFGDTRVISSYAGDMRCSPNSDRALSQVWPQGVGSANGGTVTAALLTMLDPGPCRTVTQSLRERARASVITSPVVTTQECLPRRGPVTTEGRLSSPLITRQALGAPLTCNLHSTR